MMRWNQKYEALIVIMTDETKNAHFFSLRHQSFYLLYLWNWNPSSSLLIYATVALALDQISNQGKAHLSAHLSAH